MVFWDYKIQDRRRKTKATLVFETGRTS